MELSGTGLTEGMQWLLAAAYLLVLFQAIRFTPWGWLRSPSRFNLLLGCCVVLMLLWSVRATVNDQLSFHMLGVTAITLMFGWSVGVLATSLVLIVVTFNQGAGWDWFFFNGFTTGVLPVTLSQLSLLAVRTYLPKNFFIYVLMNGFLTAGAAALASGYLAVLGLVMTDLFSLGELQQNVTPFFPLMFMPEAFLNGWIITLLVLYRPAWVYSFSDDLYLKGK